MNKDRTQIWRRAGGCAALVMAAGLLLGAASPSNADLFRGKSVTIYIGSGPGGGYDMFGRLIARHLGRFLPGAPSVLAQNMPGGGSVTAANYLFNGAPRDGTALGIVSPSLAMLDILSAPGVRFRADAFDWIGRVATIVNVTFTSAASKVKTIQDARRREALIATIDDTSPLTIVTRIMNRMAGTRFHLIEGYADSNATLMAVERGEAEGSTVSWNTLNVTKHDWLSDHKINILVQYASMRHPEMPDVPAAVELALDAKDRQIIALYVNSADVGYSLLAPPGLAGDRLNALRVAFQTMVRDSDFLADARRIGAELDPLSGQGLQGVIEAAERTPASIREEARKAAAH